MLKLKYIGLLIKGNKGKGGNKQKSVNAAYLELTILF